MKIEMAPLESCADVGGLDAQIQEIKLYEDIGFRPPKGVILFGEQGKLYLQRFYLLITSIWP
uniref:Uncharacterized protein n=1 Tax=Aegilops tauschii subsp. strangulata TaxID=200361 RepID=A0A453M4R0_AEGTS